MPFRHGECACSMSGRVRSTTSLEPPLACRGSPPTGSAPAPARQPPSAHARAVEVKAVHVFLVRRRAVVLGRREVQRLPAERALLLQDRERPEGVAAVQRNRVVEDVQDLAGSSRLAQLAVGSLAAITLRRNDSNISIVHSGAL